MNSDVMFLFRAMFRLAVPRLARLCGESLFRRQIVEPTARCCSSKPSTTASSVAPAETVRVVSKAKKRAERTAGEDEEDPFAKDKTDPRDKKDARDEKTEKSIIRQEHRFTEIPEELRNKQTFHNAIGIFIIFFAFFMFIFQGCRPLQLGWIRKFFVSLIP